MKKILAALLVLALVAPAMADVVITASDAGSQQLLISFTSSGTPAPAVRGVALTLTVTGASVASAAAYIESDFNTFMDFASITPGYTIDSGHPLALETVAGVPTFPIPAGTAFAVSVGYLDQAAGQAGLASGTVIKLQLTGIADNGSATVAISTNATRGGAVVGDNLGALTVASSATIAGPVVVTECVKSTAPFYADWVAFGKPACWCYRKACRGDIDGLNQTSKAGSWAVGTNDLNILTPAWQAIGAISPAAICADIDHAAQSSKAGSWRVGTNDLNLLTPNWQVLNPGVADCPMTNYNFWTN